MDLNQFLRERRARWQRLSFLLDRVDASGVGALNPREADELFSLYRLTSSDLNLVQTRTGNPSLIEYLEALVARGYAQRGLYRGLDSLDAIKAATSFKIVTPEEAVAIAADADQTGRHFGFAPLVGGMDPQVGWESLELFVEKVLPRVRAT